MSSDTTCCSKCGSSTTSCSSISDKYDGLISGIRKDNAKLLEIIKKQNKEIIELKKSVNKLKKGCSDTDTENYFIELDKTIAFKLDELNAKIDLKLGQMNKFVIGTRGMVGRRV